MPTFRFEFLDGEAARPSRPTCRPRRLPASRPIARLRTGMAGKSGSGRALIDIHTIAGMGHGTPIDASAAEGGSTAGPFMLDVGISSTLELARSWGIAPIAQAAVSRPAARIEIPEDRMRVDPMERPPKP